MIYRYCFFIQIKYSYLNYKNINDKILQTNIILILAILKCDTFFRSLFQGIKVEKSVLREFGPKSELRGRKSINGDGIDVSYQADARINRETSTDDARSHRDTSRGLSYNDSRDSSSRRWQEHKGRFL